MFVCECCIYETKYKSNYTKHLKTKKHVKLSNKYTTIKNNYNKEELTICQIYNNECYKEEIIDINHIDNLIKGFYKKSGKLTVSPDANSLSKNNLIIPFTKELTYKEKSNKLIKKYNSIYEKIYQEIQETYGFPGRPFPL